ncbi:plasma membrane localization protein [Massospora cicadina]|nr:plasma membrane localization protein [Massospora cicadina]
MPNCGMSCFPAKHATLVNNCYPTLAGQTSPRSNELSYLQFYTEARPEKLTKVGLYLERRVEADVWKRRWDFIKVSMEIWRAILTASPTQVNLYADPLLRSIASVLLSEDTPNYSHATATFCKFCMVNGKMTLLPDTELSALHGQLIETYCSFALVENPTPALQSRLRLCGIRALAAVGRSEILHNSDNEHLIRQIVPALVSNISAPIASPTEGPTQKRMSAVDLNEDDGSPDKINALATWGIADLARLSSVIHLRFLLDCIFRYIEEKHWWSRGEFITQLVLHVSSSAQPQIRYIPVAVVLKLLDNADVVLSFVKMQCLVTVLEALLDRRQSLVGISVLEILNTLVLRLFALPGGGAGAANPAALAAQNRLIPTIGKLGSQVYYSDQIMDVLGYLVNKLRIGSNESASSLLTESQSRVLVLQAMTQVLLCHHQAIRGKSVASKATISLNVFTPTISLLLNGAPAVRLEYFFFLHELIGGLGYHERVSKAHEADFLASLHRALFDYASNTGNLPVDYAVLYHLLASLYPGLGEQALVRTIPLIFRLQALEADDGDTNYYHHLALSGVVVHFFRSLGQEIPSDDLTKLASEIQAKREAASQWLFGLDPCPVGELRSLSSLSFEDLNRERLVVGTNKIVDIFVDPEAVSEILATCPDLRLISNDTKRQLLAAYHPEATHYDFQEAKFRIRPSRSVKSYKARGDTPAAAAEPLRIVRIENLKDALAVPNPESSEFDSDSDIQSLSIATSKKSPRELSSRVDVNHLLQSIANPVGRKSSVSLVSGPYPGF